MEMTTDLWMLVCTALLTISLPFVYLIGRVQTPGGLRWGMGNRDGSFAFPPWAERAQRAHANLLETFPVFAALVLVAHVSGKADEVTALGAMLYFGARVVHAAVYTAGLVGIRTAAFAAGQVGIVVIVVQLVR